MGFWVNLGVFASIVMGFWVNLSVFVQKSCRNHLSPDLSLDPLYHGFPWTLCNTFSKIDPNFFNTWWKVFGFFAKINSSRDLSKNEVFGWFWGRNRDFPYPHFTCFEKCQKSVRYRGVPHIMGSVGGGLQEKSPEIKRSSRDIDLCKISTPNSKNWESYDNFHFALSAQIVGGGWVGTLRVSICVERGPKNGS